MGLGLDFGAWENRNWGALGEAEERRLAREEARVDGRYGGSAGRGIEVRWGLDGDGGRVAELLELNGMPRWGAFEERFIVAERDGRLLAAVRYRTASKRLVLAMLVADPWAGERDLAVALYAGAGDLAREMGAREVLVSAGARGYPGEAGYRRRGRGWRLGSARRPGEGRGGLPEGGWRRAMALLGVGTTPFFKTPIR